MNQRGALILTVLSAFAILFASITQESLDLEQLYLTSKSHFGRFFQKSRVTLKITPGIKRSVELSYIDLSSLTRLNLTFSSVNSTISNANSTLLNISKKWQNPNCKPVYFIGGGKSGSTTMATLLKHASPNFTKYDEFGQFSRSGKEPCWAANEKISIFNPEKYWELFPDCSDPKNRLVSPDSGPKSKPLFNLDACPRYYTKLHMKKIATVHPNAKFLMLIREPVSRTISHFNDQAIRFHGSKDIEKLVLSTGKNGSAARNSLAFKLSEYNVIIQNFLSYFDSDQLLIVPTENLKNHAQQVLDEVFEFLGGRRKNIGKMTTTERNANHKSPKYHNVTKHAECFLQDSFVETRNYLETLTDYRFGWDRECVKMEDHA